jgi:hypothetical protein
MSNFRKSNGKTERVKLKSSKKAQTKTNQPAPKEQTKVNKNNKNLLAFNKSLDDKGKLIIDYLKVCSNCKNKFVTENRYANTCCDECQSDNKIRNGERFVFYTPNKNITNSFNIYEYPRRNQKTPLMPKQPELSGNNFSWVLWEAVYDIELEIILCENGFCNIKGDFRKLCEIYKNHIQQDIQFLFFDIAGFILNVMPDYSFETDTTIKLTFTELYRCKKCIDNDIRFLSDQEIIDLEARKREERAQEIEEQKYLEELEQIELEQALSFSNTFANIFKPVKNGKFKHKSLYDTDFFD